MADYLHRTATTAYPCCLPALGEFSRSWPCKTCHEAKLMEKYQFTNVNVLVCKCFLRNTLGNLNRVF